MRVAIAGNGPSLDLSAFVSAQADVLIITNRLLLSVEGNESAPSLKYVCADQRFSLSEDWLMAVYNSPLDTFLTADLVAVAKRTSGRTYEMPAIFEGGLAHEVFKIFAEEQFPLMNVVLDYAIPVALFLGAEMISLHGCDFDYGDTSESPSYWPGYTSMGAPFDHSVETMFGWSLASNRRLRELTKYLRSQGIRIGRHADSGLGRAI